MMNEDLKYDPEDIESLLLHKSFNELLADEKSFVLKHIESEAEYEHLKMTLLNSMSNFEDDEFTPPVGLKEEMMLKFKKRHQKPSFIVWLNSLFTSNSMLPFYRQPYFQLAVVGCVLVVAAFLFFEPENDSNLAVQSENSTPNKELENLKSEPAVKIAEEEVNLEEMENDVISKNVDQQEIKNLGNSIEQKDSEGINTIMDSEFSVSESVTKDDFERAEEIVAVPSAPAARVSSDNAFGGAVASTIESNKESNSEEIINEELIGLLFSAR